MKADGTVLIDTRILEDGMEKGFNEIKSDMKSIGVEAQKMGDKVALSFNKMNVEKPIANAIARVEMLENQLGRITSEMKLAQRYSDDREAERFAKQQISVFDRLEDARFKLAFQISAAAKKQAAEEEKAAKKRAAAEEAAAKKQAAAAKKRYEAATKPAKRFGSRLREIASGALVFNIISAGLRSVTDYFGKALKSNTEFQKSVAKLKGALLTSFQPVYEVIAPALTYMVQLLAASATAVGQFFSVISGTSYEETAKNAEALHNQANAIDKVASSSKKAKAQLAGFDEINKMSSTESGGTGSGSSTATKPDFDAVGISTSMQTILTLATAIGTAILTWKVSGVFTEDLTKVAGAAMAVGGTFAYAVGFADAFANGVDWGNFTEMLIGLTAAAGGLALILGPTAAAIALVVGGIGMLVVGIKDWIETGELSDATFATVTAGVLALGVGISLLTGGWIPLIIAGVAAVGLAIYKYCDEIKGVLASAWNWFYKNIIQPIADFVGAVIAPVISWMITAISDGVGIVFDLISGVVGAVIDIFAGIIKFFTGVFTGDWEKAWEGICEIVGGVFDGVVSVVKAAINSVIWVINQLIAGIYTGIASVVNGLGSIVETVGSMLGKDWGFSIPKKAPQIPYLAQGAVLPANKPFLAMVGDQKHGTNIEAPLSTIQEAVALVMEDQTSAILYGFEASVGVQREILEAVLGIQIGDEVIGSAVARYNRKQAVIKGGL